MHKRRKASVPSSGLFFRQFEETEKTYKHHILLLLPVWAAVTALSSAATALPSGHVPQWNGRLRPALVSGGLLILAAGIIHCIGKPKKTAYLLSCTLNAPACGLLMAVYFTQVGEVPQWTDFAFSLFFVICLLAVRCLLLWVLPDKIGIIIYIRSCWEQLCSA